MLILLDSVSISKHDVIPVCSVDVKINLPNIRGLSSCNPFHRLEKRND